MGIVCSLGGFMSFVKPIIALIAASFLGAGLLFCGERRVPHAAPGVDFEPAPEVQISGFVKALVALLAAAFIGFGLVS